MKPRDSQVPCPATPKPSPAPVDFDPPGKEGSASHGSSETGPKEPAGRRATVDFPGRTPPSPVALKLADMTPPPRWLVPGEHEPRAGRAKALAGLRGLKLALRRDSSFFAHAYRGVLIILAAIMVGVSPWGWCLLLIGGGLVLIAELALTAIAVLSRSIEGAARPEGLRASQEIAQGMALVATVVAFGLAGIVLVERFGHLQGWWAEPGAPGMEQSRREEPSAPLELGSQLTRR